MEDAFGEVFDVIAAGGAEGEVDFSVGADGGDDAGGGFSGAEFAEDGVGVEESGVGVLDDGFVAERGFAVDDEVDGLAGLPGWGC